MWPHRRGRWRPDGADAATCLEAVTRTCRERLPSYMVPSFIEVVAGALPRNPNGKIDRSLLKQRHSNLFAEEPQPAAVAG